jgi:hypothetical protein
VTGLVSALASDPDVTCSAVSGTVSCAAKVAGTTFTYSTNIDSAGSSSGGYFSSPGTVTPVKPSLIITRPPTSFIVSIDTPITKVLRIGQTNQEIKVLQLKLQQLGFIKKTLKPTNYFGVLTRAALIKFQKANKLRGSGMVDANTKALLNK